MPLDCIKCGACCCYSDTWPQFQTDESDTSGVTEELINGSELRMKCNGDRCIALKGTLFESVSCSIYKNRPLVCREFLADTKICKKVRNWVKNLEKNKC